jgi:hypothetical protein
VPNSDGSFTNYPGTGDALGNFTIPGVPVGFYWLVLGDTNERYWTSSDTFDLGQDYSGRPTAQTCDITTTVTLGGLDLISGTLEFVVPNHSVTTSNTENEVDFIDSLAGDSTSYTSQSAPNMYAGGPAR